MVSKKLQLIINLSQTFPLNLIILQYIFRNIMHIYKTNKLDIVLSMAGIHALIIPQHFYSAVLSLRKYLYLYSFDFALFHYFIRI